MLTTAVLFLLISFGEITPIRNALNILPGFSYFRNPAIFRLYFLTSLIIFLAILLRNKHFSELFSFKTTQQAKIIHFTIWILITIFILTFLINFQHINSVPFSSLTLFIKDISFGQTILISSIIQLIILLILLLTVKTRRLGIAKLILTADLIINTLICTPFFSVSSYSISEVHRIFHSVPGFPIQDARLTEVSATYTDEKMNTWNNLNIFKKQVSSNESYRGPLTLKYFYLRPADSSQRKKAFNKKMVFAENDSTLVSIHLLIQKPTHIRASVNLAEPAFFIVMQNYYPGWKAWYNNNKVEFVNDDKPGMTIAVPKGEGIIDFRYERKGVWLSALLLHLITFGFLFLKGFYFIRRTLFKSPSPS